MVNDHEILRRLSLLGESRDERAARLVSNRFAPRRALSASALGMWFTRDEVPHAWRAAALDVLGLVDSIPPAAHVADATRERKNDAR